MPGVRTGPAARDARFRRWARRVAGVAVVLLWATHALLSLVGGFQLVNHSQAVEDLSSGRMTSYALLEDRPGGGSSTPGWWTQEDLEPGTVEGLRTGTTTVLYTVAGSRPRLVVPDHITPSMNSWGSWTEAEVAWIEEDLVTSGLPSTVSSVVPGRVLQAHGLLGLVLVVSMLVRVVFGAAPVHGTRWFWFWLIGLPAGLGVLAWAIWEEGGWRDHRAPAPQQRSSGGYGFAVLLLGSFVLTAGSQLLAWLLGVTVIPL
ncbi:hypothetical protein [Serinicoccus chungangensis]|uniref:hypothetical protein n=1 Tax=Serinicoccus chungangensis TaxID=767452 RepID=UPI00111882B6|nr:hypothetical protein [Serinicoccus chungangensis]